MIKLLTDSEKIDAHNTISNIEHLITKTEDNNVYDNLVDAVACMKLLLKIVYKCEDMIDEGTDPDTSSKISVKFSEDDIWCLLESDDLCNNELGLNYIDDLPTNAATIKRLRAISFKNSYLQKDLEDFIHDMLIIAK